MKTIRHRKITVRTQTLKVVSNDVSNANFENACPLCHRPHGTDTVALANGQQIALVAVEDCNNDLVANKTLDR